MVEVEHLKAEVKLVSFCDFSTLVSHFLKKDLISEKNKFFLGGAKLETSSKQFQPGASKAAKKDLW